MSPQTAKPCYRLAPSPGKGLGVFATRPIAVGELIVSELPLFIGSNEADIAAGVASLSPADLGIFHSFSDCRDPEDPTDFGIQSGNGIPCGPGPQDGGLFPVISRFNHSCLPNSGWSRVDDGTNIGRMAVYSWAEIPAGEEILVSYVPAGQPLINRDRESSGGIGRLPQLKFGFGIDCTCPACQQPDALSDYRRQQIGVRTKISAEAAIENGRQSLAFPMLKQQLEMMEEEGLLEFPMRAEAHSLCHSLARSVLDQETARRHAGHAWAYSLLAHGAADTRTVNALRAWRNPLAPETKANVVTAVCASPLQVLCDKCGLEVERGEAKGKKSRGSGCGDCHCVVYCSKACRLAHREKHHTVCSVIRGSKKGGAKAE